MNLEETVTAQRREIQKLRAQMSGASPGFVDNLVGGEPNELGIEVAGLFRDELRAVAVNEELPSDIRAQAVELGGRWPGVGILHLILKLIRAVGELVARRHAERQKAEAGGDSIEEAASIREQARAEAQGIVADAHEEAGRIRLDAGDAAQNTRSIAETTLREAKGNAARVQQQTAADREAYLEDARKQAAAITDEATKTTLATAAANDHELKARSEDSQHAVRQIIEEAHKTERGIVTKGEQRAAEVLREAEEEAKTIRKAARKRAAGKK